ncbi:twin-arginine translocation signal domain-containing protein [Saccharothrix longispora]|uniref:Secreted protein n=1 Tax=Saccharothrix longispora TaxID=33920 RepID=A0ABU1PST2_9PSEU|nr:twin-arginine translocation signal domain-containing protein [Saccharothrix longispora]MDR6593651.1 hypothetical protein [Saccharothrix longispora]
MSENDLSPQDEPNRIVSRRRFLYLTGAGGLVLAVVPSGGPPGAERDLALAANATRTLHLRRREDSLNLRVDLFNADVVQTAGGAELRRVTAGSAYLVVHFPPQAVLERLLTDPLRLGDLPLPTRVSGPSRLAFDITAALPMAATLDALLGWTGFTPRLAPTATTQTTSALVAPTDTQTALELPWRVVLSPNENEGWDHSTTPVTRNGWTELWHTRMGARTAGGEVDDHAEGRTVRAVWLTDPQMATWAQNPSSVPTGNTDDVDHLLTAKQRFSIVRLSSDPTLRAGLDASLPKPIDVAELTLSSLGATLDADARWNYPANAALDLRGWQHRTTWGRDHFVRTQNAGFLFPYGHRAALVQVAERQVARRPNPDGSPGPWYAYLRRTEYVVVQQPVRTYQGDGAMPRAGRKLPFTAVRVLTRATPPLTTDRIDFANPGGAVNSFVPRVAGAPGTPFAFHLRGTDHDGHEVDFTAPVVFVPDATAAGSTTLLNAIQTAYNTSTSPDAVAVRSVDTGGRRIALASRGPNPMGSTTANADRLVLNSEAALGDRAALLAAGKAPFYPHLERAVLRLPEVAALTGGSVAATAFEYASVYLTNGIDHALNRGGVYLTVHPSASPPALDFSAAATGGVATPGGAIRGLSAPKGPITADPIQVAKELYDPAQMFGDVDKAKVLGGIPIKDLLPVFDPNTTNPDAAPTLNHRYREDISASEWTVIWTPKVEAGPKQLPVFEPLPLPTSEPSARTLTVLAVHTSPDKAGVDASYRVHGEVRDFALHLFGKQGRWRVISLVFDNLRFTQATGAKTTVDCRIREVSFHNAFKFVEELAEMCSFLGGKVDIAVGSGGVQAGLRFAVPTVALGVFELKELVVHAAVAVPFDGSAVRVTFDLNTRDRPFNLRISWFTGGGYAGIALGADGLERLEVGFTFGAALSLDVGVASGGVEAVGGICYVLERVKVVENGAEVVRQQVGLTAFLRLRGSLRFLGLVKVSVEFYLGLTYQEKADGSSVLVGEASVTVSIEVWLFSETFTVRTRRELAKTAAPAARGTSGRDRAALAAAPEVPSHPFGAAFTQQDWTEYCAAFAPVGA